METVWWASKLMPDGALNQETVILDSEPKKRLKRQYSNKWPSITQILSVIRKPGLETWLKAREGAEIDTITDMATSVGTTLHELIEVYCGLNRSTLPIYTQYPSEVESAWKGFQAAISGELKGLNIVRAEEEMMMPIRDAQQGNDFGINGTLDAIAKDARGNLALLDWKTGSSKDGDKESLTIYPENRGQVAAYAYIWNTLHPSETVEKAIIVKFSKNEPGLYTTQTLEKDELGWVMENIFFPTLTLYQALKMDAKAHPKRRTKHEDGKDENGYVKTANSTMEMA